MPGPNSKIAAFDPEIQKIFDEIKTFMGLTYVNATFAMIQDSTATTQTVTLADVRGNQSTYTTRQINSKVILSPPTASLAPGATQQFTATANDSEGKPIGDAAFTWSLSPGAQGKIDNGLYTAPEKVANLTSETVTATLNGSLAATSATVGLHP